MLHNCNNDDNDADVGIGYVYTFIISVIIMISMTYITATMIHDTSRIASKIQIQDVLERVVKEVEKVIAVVESNLDISYVKYIDIPTKVHGADYRIVATNDVIYVNSTLGFIKMKRTLSDSPVPITGSATSSAGTIKIVYNMDGVGQVITLTSAYRST
jgi:hypothetical protein